MNELRCRFCNKLLCRVLYGTVEGYCQKCKQYTVRRFDTNETVNVMRHTNAKALERACYNNPNERHRAPEA